MCRIPELLVPAGGMEQLKAAVACGADAVYVGGVSFSARAHAANFSDAELQEAIEYAHTYGVKIHVALNTLLTDRELPEALAFALQVYKYGVDAVIVQDTGLFSLIHRCIPGLSLHLSTQGTVTDSCGVRSAAERGAERVVLARELSLHEITEICRHKGNTEIEIFVHGAICISLSGQCHMSGLIGGRSGNRGDCAQPCRMRYSLEKTGVGPVSEGYQLSPKDMCLLPYLEEIARAGVDSIKVEGRMKSPEYVAAVTGIYRKHLDRIRDGLPEKASESLHEDIRVLRQMYSRGSFTDSYIKGSSDAEMMSGRSPKHQGLPIGRLKAFYPKTGHAGVRLSGELSTGDGVEIRGNRGSADNVVTFIKAESGTLVGEAQKGMQVEIGDLRVRNGLPEKGSVVYKLTDKALMQDIRQQYRKPPQRVPVRFYLNAKEGEALILEGRTEENGNSFLIRKSSGTNLEKAHSGSADREKLRLGLSRTGGTPYICTEISIEIEGSPFIPVSLLNDLRRRVLSELTQKRIEASVPSESEQREAARRCSFFAEKKLSIQDHNQWGEVPEAVGQKQRIESTETVPSGDGLSWQLYFYDTPDLGKRLRHFVQFLDSLDHKIPYLILCLPLRFFKNPDKYSTFLHEIGQHGCCFEVVLPVELRRSGWTEESLTSALEAVRSYRNFRAVLAADAGQMSILQKAGIPFELDQQMNVLNTAAASFWLEQGALSVCLSEEPECLRSIAADHIVTERCCVQVYGRLPAMYLEHCPIGAQGAEVWKRDKRTGEKPCCSTGKKYYYCRNGGWMFRDRTGAGFPVEADSTCCRAVVYSHKIIDRISDIRNLVLRGFHLFRIGIYDESPEEILKHIMDKSGRCL